MGKKIRKVSLPTMNRSGKFEPKSIDVEKRTVEVIFTKGARVLRRGFFENFFEELGLDEGQVDMSRLQNSAPVLDNHGFSNRSGVESVLGVVESAKLIPGVEGRATLRFSERADVEPIFKDIRSGILKNISVGYNTHSFEKVGEVDDTPIYRATSWTPVEISVVPSGADDGAKIRSKSDQLFDCQIIDNKIEENNNERNEQILDAPPIVETENLRNNQSIGVNEMDEKLQKEIREKAALEARNQEKSRQIEIRSICNKVGLKDEVAEKYINEDLTVEKVRELVIDELAKKDKEPENQIRNNTPVQVGEDLSRSARLKGMTDALLHRFRPHSEKRNINGKSVQLRAFEMTDEGRQFAYLSLIDMARHCLNANNIRTEGMAKHQIADTALKMRSLHSTSDFPEILANVANKTLRNGYLSAPQTWMPFTNEVTTSDFKQISRTNLGDAPALLKLEEGSEVKRGSMSESAEKYNVEEYARIIGLTRKTIVNDDLGAFTKIPERYGIAAADLESDLVWAVITANAALSDGFNLFSAQHANLSIAPGVPSEAGLTEGRKSMRLQKGLDGRKISLIPVFMFVPPSQETVAEKLLATILPNSSAGVSPFSASGRTPLQLDIEPRLEDDSDKAWYLTAEKGRVDMVELARLEGTDGPTLSSRDGFDINGVELKVGHDVGVKAIDHRGLFKNAGA